MIITWIEDDENLKSLIKPLQDAKHDVFIYGSINEVNDNIETVASSDVIILDIILPTTGALPAINGDMLYSGYKVLRNLISEYNYKGKVIILSSVLNPLVYKRFQELGVLEKHMLEKPIRPSKLFEVVSRVFEEKSEREDLK